MVLDHVRARTSLQWCNFCIVSLPQKPLSSPSFFAVATILKGIDDPSDFMRIVAEESILLLALGRIQKAPGWS
jgi:hypothetical protein